jgi:hypothetical protein
MEEISKLNPDIIFNLSASPFARGHAEARKKSSNLMPLNIISLYFIVIMLVLRRILFLMELL